MYKVTVFDEGKHAEVFDELETYEAHDLDRAYEIFDSEEHATLTHYAYVNGEYTETELDRKGI